MSMPFFPDEEYEARLRNVRQKMAERDLDACLISSPENIYYLSGLDYWGFFAYHVLIVPREGEIYLSTRRMERVTIEKQVKQARFVGYADSDDPARLTCEILAKAGLASARLGIEKGTLFLPPRIAEGIIAGAPQAHWSDISNLVDELRLVKSPREQEYTRQAAAVTDTMMRVAIDTARAGINEREVAAEVHRAMILAGGEYPGFGPFIRPSARLGEEHTTWGDSVLKTGDTLFLELSGCVRRYHAPMGRIIFIGKVPEGTKEIEQLCLAAFNDVVKAIRPGVKASEVYQTWQDRVNSAGLSHYRRHHCGYLVGIGFPPSWTGGSMVTGLRHDSNLVLQTGMVFHLMSWLMGTGRPGDYFVSNAAILTEKGCEVLTTVPGELQIV